MCCTLRDLSKIWKTRAPVHRRLGGTGMNGRHAVGRGFGQIGTITGDFEYCSADGFGPDCSRHCMQAAVPACSAGCTALPTSAQHW